jgi:hypothetical protein
MRRQCGRPGCSVVATVTFTFDATRCVVWLDDIADGTPRAGDLCTRHADALVPPKGWERVDRRTPTPVVVPQRVASVHEAPARGATARRARRPNADETANLFDAAPAAPSVGEEVVAEAEAAPSAPAATAPPLEPSPSWLPRNATEADLDGVLSASSPLLSRAFRNARGDGPDDDNGADVDPDAF